MYEAVIFDFDGVIIDSEPLHFEASVAALKKCNIVLNYNEYCENYIGLSDKEMFPKIFAANCKLCDAKKTEFLIRDKINKYIDIIQQTMHLPFIAGLEQYINFLRKQSAKLAICSGSAKEEIVSVLSRSNIKNMKDLFDVIVSYDDVSRGKPDPEGYLLASKRLNVLPEKCLVIEDTPFGIKAARAAGMTVIGLLTTHNEAQLKEAHIISKNFLNLPDIE